MQRDVFHFQKVEVPYRVARGFMRDDPTSLFRTAVDASSVASAEIQGNLDVDLDGIIMGADVTLDIGDFEEVTEPLPLAKRHLGWHATHHAGMFPILTGELEAFPVGSGSTQVTFTCHYRPPLKAVGAIADTVYLHRIAEECLERFFSQVIESLKSLVKSAPDEA